jgi:nitrous oxide reductase accessory protein NosL
MQKIVRLCIASIFITLIIGCNAQAEPVNTISPNEKCRVCGMFVAKYQPWVAQIHLAADDVAMFDGVKDMMAYYFEPYIFGGTKDPKNSDI